MNYRNVWHGTIGADPEMFVFAGRKLLPAYEFLPDKRDPKNPLIYWDGFQAEWKYKFGQFCMVLFVQETQKAMRYLLRAARKHNPKATLSLQNVVSVPKELLNKAPEQYVALGCEPSHNAYGLQAEHISNPRELRIRVAGGHLHFGDFQTKPQHEHFIRVLDSVVGIWSVGAAQNIDVPIRRKYYGMAGEFRTPHYESGYGIEYRTLSNFWLCHPKIMQLTFQIARGAMMLAKMKDNPWVAMEDEVVKTINNCDVKHAQTILQRNKLLFDTMLLTMSAGWSEKDRTNAFQVGIEGVESAVNIDSIEKNWSLGRAWSYDSTPTWREMGS